MKYSKICILFDDENIGEFWWKISLRFWIRKCLKLWQRKSWGFWRQNSSRGTHMMFVDWKSCRFGYRKSSRFWIKPLGFWQRTLWWRKSFTLTSKNFEILAKKIFWWRKYWKCWLFIFFCKTKITDFDDGNLLDVEDGKFGIFEDDNHWDWQKKNAKWKTKNENEQHKA